MNGKMKIAVMMICMALMNGMAFAQHDHSTPAKENTVNRSVTRFKDVKLGIAYEHYIHLKDALVASNSDGAKTKASELQKALKDVDGSTAAIDEASKISTSSDLKVQRDAFSALSNEMVKLVKGGKLSEGALYLEYCPMANSNAGAYWISNEKEIQNPYFGAMMLRCGSVEETIE